MDQETSELKRNDFERAEKDLTKQRKGSVDVSKGCDEEVDEADNDETFTESNMIEVIVYRVGQGEVKAIVGATSSLLGCLMVSVILWMRIWSDVGGWFGKLVWSVISLFSIFGWLVGLSSA